ncbi:uncharacterized protein LOC123540692 [Mercenaria mercenaria]|uniref:uncharacterized protein LOC123540692 n=1 Tax=Mercenaria mercenaria TaxID=6596 RepID=UPI00234F95D6|nr:uncharacterized protein LOC123540692 [Mercenaria mercenaria]
MAAPFNDATKDIPGYKIILKSVLKSQIQHLVEQLAANTDEESVILTASVSDGTLSHLGSQSGNDFLNDHEDIKLQFLGFCLKNHYERRLEMQRQETETYSHDSKTQYMSNFGDDNETYTATTFIPPPTSDSVYNVTAKPLPCRSPARSPRVRFEPYMSPKRSRKYLYNLHQDRYRNHVFGQSVFNVPNEHLPDEGNVDIDESSKVVEPTKESTDFPFSRPSLKTESCGVSDQTLTKCDNDSGLSEIDNVPESKFKESGNMLEPGNKNPNQEQKDYRHDATENDVSEDIDDEDDTTCSTSAQQCDGSNFSISSTEANQNQKDILQIIKGNGSGKFLNVEKHSKCSRVEPDLHADREGIKTPNSVTKSQIKANGSSKCNENTEKTQEMQDTAKMSDNSSASANNKGDQDNHESYLSRLRSSRSLQRKYEVNNALKLSHARRASRRGAGREHHARVSCSLSTDIAVSNTCDTSATNTESEYENSELQENGHCNIKVETPKDPLRNPQCNKKEIRVKDNEEESEQEQDRKEKEVMKPELIKQETNSDSESELEIIAIEPGSVFLFKDSLSKLKKPEDTGAKQKKVFIKRGRKLGVKMKKKTTGENEEQVFQRTNSNTEGRLCPPAPYVTKLRRFKSSVAKIKPCSSSLSISGECSSRESSDRLPITKLTTFNSGIERSAGPSANRDEVYVESISETEISSTQNLNSNEAGEFEILEVDEPDSSNLSDVKANKSDRNFIDEDTPSPISLSNSYLESEDYNDEMTSDSSVSLTRFSKFAMGTHQTEQDPVSNRVDSNVNAKLKRLRSKLNLQISQVRSGRTELNKDKWGSKSLKTKKLLFRDVASKKGIRLAKQQRKKGIHKHRRKRKERKLLKLGIKVDPETYCYTIAPSTAELQDSSSSQSRNRIPSMIFTKLSLDSQMKSLSLSNDDQSTQSPQTIKSQRDSKEHDRMFSQEQIHCTDQDVYHEYRPVQKQDSSSEQKHGSESEQNQSLDSNQTHVLVSTENQRSKQKYVLGSEQNQGPKSQQGLDSEAEQTKVFEDNKQALVDTMVLQKQPDVDCSLFEKFTTRTFNHIVYDPNCALTKEGMQLENERKHLNKANNDNVSENHGNNSVENNGMQPHESKCVRDNGDDRSSGTANPGNGNKKNTNLSNIFVCSSENNVRDNDADGSSGTANPGYSNNKNSTLSNIPICTSEVNFLPSSLRFTISKLTGYDSTVPHSNDILQASDKICTSSPRSNIDKGPGFQNNGSANTSATDYILSFKQSVPNVNVENSQSQSTCPVNNPYVESPLLISSCMLKAHELFEDKQCARSSKESTSVDYVECKDSCQLNSVPEERQEIHLRLNSFNTGLHDSSDMLVNGYHDNSDNVVEDSSRSLSLPSLTDTVTSLAAASVAAASVATTSIAAAETSPLTLSLSSLTTSSCSLSLSVSRSLNSSPSSSPLTSYLSSPVPSSSPSSSTSSSLSSPLIPKFSNENDSEITDVIRANNNKDHIQSTQQDSYRKGKYQHEDSEYFRNDHKQPAYIDTQCDINNVEDCYFHCNLKIKRENEDILLVADGQNKNESVQVTSGSDVLRFNDLEPLEANLSSETEIFQDSAEESIPDNKSDGNAKNQEEEPSFSECMVNSKYTCDTCGMMFQFKSTLTEHMGTHTGKNKHMGVHAGEELCTSRRKKPARPVVHAEHCTSKKKKSQRKYLMENRSIFRSKKRRRFTCTYCGRKYCLKSSLEKHIKCDHVREIYSKCQVCGSSVEKNNTDISIKGSIRTNIPDNGKLAALPSYCGHPALLHDSNNSIVLNDCSTSCGHNISEYPTLRTDNSLPAIRNDSDYSKGLNGSKSQSKSKKYATVCEKCKYLLQSETDSRAENDNQQVPIERHTSMKNESEKDGGGSNNIGITESCECDLCEKKFSSKNSLKVHVHTIHYGELFKCNMCRKTFTMEENFERHKREIHENKRSDFEDNRSVVKSKYHCGVCGLPFKGSMQLRIHMGIVHSKKRFKCHKCKRTFSYKACLKRHVLAIHS